jgi:N-acetylmuramoyl-L-alanine amidase
MVKPILNIVGGVILFVGSASVESSNSEVECLSKIIYHEARGESLKGKKAVGMVAINRSKNSKFPSSICAVMLQPKQFSWVRKRPKIKDHVLKRKIDGIARTLYNSYHVKKSTPNGLGHLRSALFFRSGSRPNKKQVAKVGQHRFYRGSY